MCSVNSRRLTVLFLALISFCIISGNNKHPDWNDVDKQQKQSHLEYHATEDYSFGLHDSGIIDTTLNELGGAIKRYLTQLENTGNRRKRTVYVAATTWQNKTVPFVFDPAYSDELYRNVLRRIMKYLTDHSCLTFVDETTRWTNNDPNWFLDNGYRLASCIRIRGGPSCMTIGSPKNGSTVDSYVCAGTAISFHEICHALLVSHTQQDITAPRYINVFYDDICSNRKSSYISNNPHNKGLGYDIFSFMHYDSLTWTCNYGETYACIRKDMCERGVWGASGEETIFEEINTLYNCTEPDGVAVDCSPGYYTRVNGVYQCVCPHEFDYKSNCKKFIEEGDSSLTWPVPMSVFAAGTDFKCPPGLEETGSLKFCGTGRADTDPCPVPLPESGGNMTFPVCSKTTPTTNIDYNKLPIGGKYCFIKAKGVACNGVFNEYGITMKSVCPIESNGTLGDIVIDGNNVTIKMCCMEQDNKHFPLDLPNTTPFRLFSGYDCPNIRGMRYYNYFLGLATNVASYYGGPASPYNFVLSDSVQFFICYMQPAVYGCSQNVTLNANNRKVTITTPDFPKPRSPNQRCFYCFNAAPGSQFRVTFNYFKLDGDDWFLIKRFYKWLQPYLVDNSKPPYQFVTEKNYLCLHFWAGYKAGLADHGVNFTVEVLLKEDSCFNTETSGMEYVGDTNISETYEPCLNWKDTTACSESPINSNETLTGFFEGNKCRNSMEAMLQPWCFVYKNGTNCVKRYCDVCNTKEVLDQLATSYCTEAIKNDPTFCTTALQRFGCLKSCNMARPPATVPGQCNRPPLPSDGMLLEKQKKSYRIGERVRVSCKSGNGPSDSTSIMVCKQNGWTPLLSACHDCPPQWIPYKKRCVMLPASKKKWPDANAYCKAQGLNGTLFQIWDETDHLLLRKIRTQMESTKDSTIISGSLDSEGIWRLTDTSVQCPYLNFTASARTNTTGYGCLVMYREDSTTGAAGGIQSIDCASTTNYPFACQMARFGQETEPAKDKYSTCQTVLSDYPNFCTDSKTSNDAIKYCSKSCGLSTETPTCTAPTTTTYNLTSKYQNVRAGETMNFDCNPGYFLISGDLTRACGTSGELLGTEPVCDNKPPYLDVGMFLVRDRKDSVPSNCAMLLDLPLYRVPIAGKINMWYYYCEAAGTVSFIVYRNNSGNYTFLGENTINCVPEIVMSYSVPPANQTSVQPGDLVGVYIPKSYILSATDCNSATEKIMYIPTNTDAHGAEGLTFPTKNCIIPSIAYRVAK